MWFLLTIECELITMGHGLLQNGLWDKWLLWGRLVLAGMSF